jgi:hypothetical protein
MTYLVTVQHIHAHDHLSSAKPASTRTIRMPSACVAVSRVHRRGGARRARAAADPSPDDAHPLSVLWSPRGAAAAKSDSGPRRMESEMREHITDG